MYPRRVGTNRTNPYTKPRQLQLQLKQRHAASFDNRHCGAGMPSVTNVPLPPLPPAVGDLVPRRAARQHHPVRLRTAPANAPAPPCRAAGPVQLRRRDHAVPARQREMTPFERIVRASARRPGRVLAIVAVLAAVGCALALRLEPSAATDTLVGRGADTFQATERYRERFGDHSVIVLVRGELSNLAAHLQPRPPDRARGLPVGQQAGRPARRRAARARRAAGSRALKPVQVVYGPGTFANASVGEINDQIQVADAGEGGRGRARRGGAARRVARAQGKSRGRAGASSPSSARQLVYAQFVRDLLQINLKYGLGLTGLPSVDDPNFVSALFFDPSRGADDAEGALRLPVPVVGRSALIQVRLKPDLTDAQRGRGGRARARGRADAGVASSRATPATRSPARRWWPRTSPTRWPGSTLRLLLVGLVRDGARAGARLPQPAAAGAAGGRAGRGGDHVRGDGAASARR